MADDDEHQESQIFTATRKHISAPATMPQGPVKKASVLSKPRPPTSDQPPRLSFKFGHEAREEAGRDAGQDRPDEAPGTGAESAPCMADFASQDTVCTPQNPSVDGHDQEKGPVPQQSSRWRRPFQRHIRQPGEPTPFPTTANEDGFLHGISLFLVIMGICMVIFLISVDRTIITTAIPFITEEFRSTSDTGWYGSAYLVTTCGFQPTFGRIYAQFNLKWMYIASITTFCLGSLLCALAPSSAVFIVGRAVAGLGSAGIITGSFVISAIATPLKSRPIYTAIVGFMFGVGATVGPVLGGIFTDLVTWRWCFWVNLPVAALPIIFMVFVFHYDPPKTVRPKIIDRLISLDLIGTALFLGGMAMLFTALEDIAAGKSWTVIIGLLCGFGSAFLLFIAWQWWKQDGALMPPAILKQRTVAASCIMSFFLYGILLIHAYFLPIWFQAVLGDTAIQSGVAMIPYVVANAIMTVVAGAFVSFTGYFTPPSILGCIIGTIGAGTITMFHPDISTGHWVGFMILTSAGFGMAVMQGFTAVQTVFKDEVPMATAAVVASQSLGGAVFVSVANAIFQSRLRTLTAEFVMPGFDITSIIAAGATAFRHLVPADMLPAILVKCNIALRDVFYVAIPLGGLAFIAACCMEWNSVKDAKHAGATKRQSRQSITHLSPAV